MKKLIAYFHTAANAPASCKVEGAARAAAERGWSLLRFDIRSMAVAREEIRFWQPDGIIVDAVAASREILCEASFRRYPCVFIDCDSGTAPSDISCLWQDPEATARAAAEELLRHDLRCFAYAGWPGKAFWSEARGKAFAAALSRHGKGMAELDIREAAATRKSVSARLAEWLRSLPHPVGVFAATDPMAAQVLEAAESIGLNSPGDIMVAGVDNDETFCEYTRPSITSVSIDFAGMGRRAIELIEAKMEEPAFTPVHEAFSNTRTVRRSSTRRAEKHDAAVTRALDYIRAHATEGIGAADVLALFKCSRRLAEMRFRRLAGRSILDEIHALQVEHAKRLLSNPMQKISAVPELCGHASAPFFMKLFRKTTGMTMSDWRNLGESRLRAPE